MSNYHVTFLLFLVVSASTIACAGEVDSIAHMNSQLATKPSITYLRDDIIPIIEMQGGVPQIRTVTVKTPYNAPAKVANSYVAEVTALAFDKAKLVSLPEITLFTQKQLLNCADTNISSTVSLSLTGTKSWSISKTDGVSTTVAASTTGSAGVPGYGSGSMTFSWSQAISTSTTKQEGFQETTTKTMSDTISIGPRKAANVSLLAYQATIELPFSAPIVVDGDLVGNSGGPQKASALLSKDERTLPLRGTIRLTDISEATVRTDDIQGQAGCDGNAGKIVIQETPQAMFKTAETGLHLKSGFAALSKAPRIGNALMVKSQRFALMSPLGDDPVIGPPDGTSYEILYTTEVAKPAVSCGFNDLGVPNTGIFSVEARQYRTYVNGQLISQYQEFVEMFKSCFTP